MRRRRQRGGPDLRPPGAPLWSLTYGDLVTQLLAFFVLLYSMSSLDAAKYRTVIASFGSALSGGAGALSGGMAAPPAAVDPQLLGIQKQVKELLVKNDFAGDVQVQILDGTRLVVRFPEQVLFHSGSADMSPEARRRLDALVPVLRDIPNRVRVEGHTDSDPISGSLAAVYPSNWELSNARAATVLRYFTEFYGLDPGRFETAGRGEWDPVAPNDTPENKAKNRRVDLVVQAGAAR